MKRVLCLILSLLILSVIAGCGQSEEMQQQILNTAGSTAPTPANTQVCQSLPTFLTLEDYSVYISAGADMKNFITYEMVQEYGDFVCFVDCGHPRYSNYLYGLIDKNGYHLSLNIRSLSSPPKANETINDIQLHNYNNLRTNPTQHSTVTANNIQYNYYEGKLYSIEWYTDTHAFSIEAGRTVRPSDYPNNEVTLISRLLDGETAAAAVAEFNAKIAAARQDREVKGME